MARQQGVGSPAAAIHLTLRGNVAVNGGALGRVYLRDASASTMLPS